MKYLFLISLLYVSGALFAQTGVLIAPTSGTPDANAVLELRSTTQGFLPPRLTTTQRNNINTPPNGLIVFNTSTRSLNVYDATINEQTELATVPSTPATRTITVGSTAFTSVDSREECIKAQGQGGAYLLPVSPATTIRGSVVASLQIPVGSRITNVTFYYRDRTSSAEMSLRLYREIMTFGSFSSIHLESTGVVNASPDWTSVSADLSHVVNSQSGYFISAFSNDFNSDLSIKGASITYIPPTN